MRRTPLRVGSAALVISRCKDSKPTPTSIGVEPLLLGMASNTRDHLGLGANKI